MFTSKKCSNIAVTVVSLKKKNQSSVRRCQTVRAKESFVKVPGGPVSC